MAHLVSEPGLLDRGDRVSPADDGDGALGGQLGERLGDAVGALGEGVHLEDAHGTVPDDLLAVGESGLERLERVRADVEAHPPVGDGINGDDLRLGVGGKLVGDDNVRGEDELDALLLGHRDQLAGQVQLVLLNQGGADGLALRLVEGEDHAPAQEDLVDLVDERLDDADLRRHLGAADDGSEGPLGLRDGAVKVVELLLHAEAGDRRGEVLGDALGRAVRAVRRAERVVDVDVGVGGERLGEVGLVLGLSLVEADVLEDEELA